MWWESTLWFVERRLVVDRITLPARADRQAAGGAGYLGTSSFLWLMDRWGCGCVRASVGFLM